MQPSIATIGHSAPRALSGLIVAAALLASVGCGARNSAPSRTDLTIAALNPNVGRASFHLTCAPEGGNISSAAKACQTLATAPQLLATSKPFVCAGGPSSWWDISISGRLNGKRFRRTFTTCWTPQMTLIGRLGIAPALQSHLLPRRTAAIVPGTRKTFTASVLRPADLVTCMIRGHRLQVGVPLDAGPAAEEGFAGDNVIAVSLQVALSRDGSVTASCGDTHNGVVRSVDHLEEAKRDSRPPLRR